MTKKEKLQAEIASIMTEIEFTQDSLNGLKGKDKVKTQLTTLTRKLVKLKRMLRNRRKDLNKAIEQEQKFKEKLLGRQDVVPFVRKESTRELVNTEWAEYMREYNAKNRERIRELQGIWRAKNVEKMKEYRRRWYEKHKEKHKKNVVDYIKRRSASDPMFRREMKIRSALTAAMRHDTHDDKTSHMVYILGYTPTQLRERLEPQQQALIAQGKVPSIDHLIPIKYFKPGSPEPIVHSLDNLHMIELDENLDKQAVYAHPVRYEYFCLVNIYIKDEFKDKISYVKPGEPEIKSF